MLQRVHYMSQCDAESMFPAPGSAIISITDPDATAASLHAGWASVLRLAFEDIDPRYWEPEDGKVTPLSESQAVEIARFVEVVSSTCRVLVVHCRYGQSRSAATARAICEVKGFAVPEATRSANPFVYELVKQALVRQRAAGNRSR